MGAGSREMFKGKKYRAAIASLLVLSCLNGEAQAESKPCPSKSSGKDSRATTTSSVPADSASAGIFETKAAEWSDVEKFKAAAAIAGKPKIGLALGGGGARGAAHIGALKVLEEAGIKFDYIAGTSIGSVVGGFIAAGVPARDLEQPFESGELMHKFMTVPLAFRIGVAPILYVPRILGAHPYDGLYKGGTFRKYLVAGLPCDEHEIDKLKIPFAAVALNIVDGKPYMIRKGSLGYAMQASCAVPSLRKPVEIDGKLFVDGGVACNLPVKQVRDMGADFVIAINIDQPFKEEPLDTFRKPGSIARRMINWDLHVIDAPQAALADVTIHPDTSGISLVSRRKSDARRAVLAGEEAARKALPLIKEKLESYLNSALNPEEK